MTRAELRDLDARLSAVEDEVYEMVRRRSSTPTTPRPSMPPPESEAPEIGDPLPERW